MLLRVQHAVAYRLGPRFGQSGFPALSLPRFPVRLQDSRAMLDELLLYDSRSAPRLGAEKWSSPASVRNRCVVKDGTARQAGGAPR
jgi:hypothetical protein